MNKTEETEEIYTLAERWIILLTIYILSLFTSITFLYRHIKIKKNNIIIFIICVIYSSLFVFLNVIGVFDLAMNNINRCKKMMNMIKKYYEIFSWVDRILGFIIFNIIIYYIESGWYWFPLRLLDSIIRLFCSFKKVCEMKRKGTLCKTLLILSIPVLLACSILILLIIYRKHFGLNGVFDYISCLFNCYSIFKIYSAVGFFLLKLYKDCCKIYNKRLIRRYYRYSQIKIIEKTKEYLGNIKRAYILMNENASIFKNGDSSYHKFLQKKLSDIQKEINELIGEGNSVNIIINNTDYNASEANINKNNIYNNLNLNEKNKTVNPAENVENVSTQKTEKKLNDYKIARELRKFKESKRRINKLKKLSKIITEQSKKDLKEAKIHEQKERQKGKKVEEDEETKEEEKEKTIEVSINNIQSLQDQNNKKEDNVSCREACCNCCVIILLCYSVFFILINDFLLPLLFKYGVEEGDMKIYDDKDEKEKNVVHIILSVIIIFPITALCSVYTFIMIYTHTKKSYITGDFLYDEKINDGLNLLKSVQIICGFSSAIVYCNLYYWKAIDKFGEIGKPIYYGNTIIPDYKISGGLTVYYIIKLAIIIFSIFAHLKLDNVTVFQNDLAEFYLSKDACKYDTNNELEKLRKENTEVTEILKNEIKDEKNNLSIN